MTALALAVALLSMPELVSLYNENRLVSTHLLRQRGKEPLHAVQLQVCCCSRTLHACQLLASMSISKVQGSYSLRPGLMCHTV